MLKTVSVLSSGAFQVQMSSHNEPSLMHSSCLATHSQSSLCASASPHSFVTVIPCVISCQEAFFFFQKGPNSAASQKPTISKMAKETTGTYISRLWQNKGCGAEVGGGGGGQDE